MLWALYLKYFLKTSLILYKKDIIISKIKGTIMENNSTILTNDPYLNTARLTIRDKRYKNLYTKRMEKRSFLKQK